MGNEYVHMYRKTTFFKRTSPWHYYSTLTSGHNHAIEVILCVCHDVDPFKFSTSSFFSANKGRFTPCTMESDHGRWPSCMVWRDGPNSMVRFLIKKKRSIYNAFGPLSRCKPNVDQQEWPCTKKSMCCFFINICLKHAVLRSRRKNNNKIKINHSLVFSCLHFPPKKLHQKINIKTVLCHGPLPTTVPTLPPTPPKPVEACHWVM